MTYTPEQMRRTAKGNLRMFDMTAAEMISQGADAVESLDAADESVRRMQDRLQRLIDGAAAKDAELARLTIERDKARDAHAALCPYNAALAAVNAKVRKLRTTLDTFATASCVGDYQRGWKAMAAHLVIHMDALGLTGEEPR